MFIDNTIYLDFSYIVGSPCINLTRAERVLTQRLVNCFIFLFFIPSFAT